jgi:hypothetical protein
MGERSTEKDLQFMEIWSFKEACPLKGAALFLQSGPMFPELVQYFSWGLRRTVTQDKRE